MDLATEAGRQLLTQGVLGIVCLIEGLVIYVVAKALQQSHHDRLADALKLSESREAMVAALNANNLALEASNRADQARTRAIEEMSRAINELKLISEANDQRAQADLQRFERTLEQRGPRPGAR